MNVGFEASNASIKNPTGISRYIFNLIGALQKDKGIDATLFYKLSRLKKRHNWWRPEDCLVKVYQEGIWPPVKGVDIVHGLDGVAPRWRNVKRVVTVHDIFPLLTDEDSVVPASFRTKKQKIYAKLSNFDAIISVSPETKRDLVKTFALPESMIHVVPQGIEAVFQPYDEPSVKSTAARYGIEGEYLLFIGAISGRKNTARLVEAFARSAISRRKQLVLAGALAYGGEETLETIRRLGIGDRVKITGFVADEDLPAIYSGADAFLFPTLYEGFGIPILEAMACGTPVLVGDRGASSETAGGHAVVVDPYDVDVIARGMEETLAVSTEAQEAARSYAAGHTWGRCAEGTLAVYRDLLKTR